ncbi:MAG: hypothetical protein ABIQ41_00270 [Gemmatimonadales bacterium]
MTGYEEAPLFPGVMTHERFVRACYNESLLSSWVSFDVAVLVFGVLIHINLHVYAGIAMLFAGLVLLLISAATWAATTIIGDEDLKALVTARYVLLQLRVLVCAVVFAFGVWAVVVMINKTPVGTATL